MVTKFRGKIKEINKIIISMMTAILVAVIALSSICTNTLLADNEINLSLDIPDNDYHPGDIITVSVIASSMPNITRFGPIELSYNPDEVSYISVQQPAELSGFALTATAQNTGILSISAVDDSSESLIQNQQEDENFVDPSFYSEETTILFKASFRILQTNQDSVSFSINEASSFQNGYGEAMTVRVLDSVNVEIADGVSNDSTLAALSISGVSLSPEFSSDLHEYTAVVSSQTTEVVVNFTPANLWSAVVVGGTQNLQIGDNEITIDITAQDSVTSSQYKIIVTRMENYVPEGVYLIDALGASYTFVNLPQDVTVPEGFMRSNRIINGYSVPVFMMDGVTSVLVYLYDGNENTGFYFYNSTTKTLTPYEPENTIISTSHIMTLGVVDSSVQIPPEFHDSSREISGITYPGYENDEGLFICYLSDEVGTTAFYALDENTGNWSEYRSVDRTGERIYGALFYMFLGISVVEGIMLILVVHYIRKMVSQRTNPRPRRV